MSVTMFLKFENYTEWFFFWNVIHKMFKFRHKNSNFASNLILGDMLGTAICPKTIDLGIYLLLG